MTDLIFVVVITEDPNRPEGKRVKLYDRSDAMMWGDRLGMIDAPSIQHIPAAVGALFAAQFGNPDKPPLREVPKIGTGETGETVKVVHVMMPEGWNDHPYPCPICNPVEYDRQVEEGKIKPRQPIDFISANRDHDGHPSTRDFGVDNSGGA